MKTAIMTQTVGERTPAGLVGRYREFLAGKTQLATSTGLDVGPAEVHPLLLPHQRDAVVWAVRGGRRAIFASFGLGKTLMQLEACRLVLARTGDGSSRALIVCPLGVRQEFARDAWMIGLETQFIRSHAEASAPGIYLTNYESIRDGKLDPRGFDVISLDEAAILRGFGGTKTFRELMRLYEGSAAYRFVATATPSPNEYIELASYAAFLDILDVGQIKTRFFKRDSEKADHLTLHSHMEREFWLWVSSWALFLQKPSDLGYSDEGYALPPLDVRWHEVPSETPAEAEFDRDGRGRLFRNSAMGVQEAAAEKRSSLGARVAKVHELVGESPGDHFLLWHDLEAERHAIAAALPEAVAVWGSQDLEERERRVADFSDGKTRLLASKPVLTGSGCNFQRHCHRAVFTGIGFKFHEFVQSIHRIHRFLQTEPVRIDLIYTEAERDIRKQLERKWAAHNELVARMGEIIREYGLSHEALSRSLARSSGVARREASGEGWRLVNNDAVEETAAMADGSVGLIVTSIPFSTQYEYTPAYEDFGHSEDNAHFWAQMDFLTPELLRVLAPGRVAVIHVKDRIAPGGLTGLGFQTVQPFHAEAITHYTSHGFAYLGMRTVVTDVVRENNQTYRLGWTEQCKDGTRMGCGMPEYLLIFRKPPTDSSDGYADTPVVKDKASFSRSRWQTDAHGFWRSNGDRPIGPADFEGLSHTKIFRLFRDHFTEGVYDHEAHVAIGEALEAKRRLPTGFMLLQPPSWHPDVWTDVARMRTLNMLQERKGRQMHLCLARGSLVLTRDGYKPIQEVVVGEHVLTHCGRWRPVLAVQNTGVRPVVTVKAQGVPGLTLTPDHKLWTRAVRDIPWARSHSRRDAAMAEPGWTEARDTVGSYVNFKLPETEWPAITDPLHWWAVGRWLADGHWESHGGVIISCGVHEIDGLVAKLGRFGGNPAHRDESAAQILLRDPGHELRSTLKACGQYAHGKHLPPEAFTLPAEQAAALLDGYLSGDGHYLPERNRWTASSVSRELLLGVAVLAQRAHGAIASIYPGRPGGTDIIQGRTVSTRPDWVLCFDIPDAARKNGLPFVLADGAWRRVRSCEPTDEAETWNLRVAEDESYTAEGCIVKNCPLQFDIVERLIRLHSMPGETVFDPFAGLGTVPYMAVKMGRPGLGVELNPQYFADSLVYLRAAEAEASAPTLFDLVDAEGAS